MIDWSKYDEYVQRGLPHIHKDGMPCRCRECEEARRMGLGSQEVTFGVPASQFVREVFEREMLQADPDWKPRT